MSDWIPSLNSLRVFEAVVRQLSYKAADDELCNLLTEEPLTVLSGRRASTPETSNQKR